MTSTVQVVATELYRARITPQGSLPRFKLGSTTVHATVVQIVTYIGYSQIGFVCVFVLTNLTKNCLGRLRPHFIDVCKPVNITCRGNEYYENYVCSGNPVLVSEARKSFFSGHSAFSMYASTFAAVYLLARIPRHTFGRAALPVIQTTVIAIGLLISFSRINDNKHHWSDVIVGILVGMFIAVYTVSYIFSILKIFQFLR
ncbi:PAP2 family protein [Teladorsagia circumcincta]|uniref:PAP2 family protein n=1 Tax=Teladorsagia circumcincta TaxID=45464 RepID=A0A2G9UFV2_TELCI|nr:PAP2 family protein [Teladorsagia circumcincta]